MIFPMKFHPFLFHSLTPLLCCASLAHAAEPPRLSPEAAAALCQKAAASPVPELAGSFSPLIGKCTPAVVSVFPAVALEESDEKSPMDRFFGKTEEEKKDEDSPHERITGVGSGVIISPDGWIVTNSHVVHLPNGKVADRFFVDLHDQRRFAAEVAGYDEAYDLALLKIDAKDLSFLKLANSDEVLTGDRVFAIGNPFQVGITATMGMVSATRRSNLAIGGENAYESFIQTDAAINPGNSGGALIDTSGRLLGINTAIYAAGGGNVGIGFAIPSNLVSEVVGQLASEGKVTRGFFGLQVKNLTDATAKKAQLPRMAGAVVESIMTDGPAAKAGLAEGDVITAVNGKPVIYRGDLRYELSRMRPGQKASFNYWRDGKEQGITITAGTQDTAGKAEAVAIESLPGAKFSEKGSKLVVVEVSSAKLRKAGLSIGMVILEANDQKIASLESLKQALRSGVNQLKVTSEDSTLTLAIDAE
jgi:Do/DeqQ family serine protease